MSDYISRDAAVKIAQKYGLANGSALGRHTGLADCIAIEIEGIPAADVEPVRYAEWKLIGADKLGRGGIWECTGLYGCGKSFPLKCDYCPNCGAKMDLENNNGT